MTITWEQILAFLCEDQSMAITSLLFLAFFAAVALINYALPRVHMAYIGRPLAGDTLYGGSDTVIARHALHCAILHFAHPLTGKPIRVECPLPADMAALAETENLLDGWQLSSLPCGEDALT